MAMTGRKPKPAWLKVIDGNPGHRPIPPDAAQAVPTDYDNALEPPKRLRKRQAELWALYVRRAPWLTAFDVARAHMWVELHAEWERKPEAMISGRIAQLRALGSELGLDPASRARLGASNGGKKNDPAEKYLT